MGYSRARSTAVVILLLLAYASTTVDARSKVQGRKALRSQVYEGKALRSQKKFMGLSSALEAAGSSVSVVAAGSSYIVDSASGAAALLKDQAVINLQDLILKTVKPFLKVIATTIKPLLEPFKTALQTKITECMTPLWSKVDTLFDVKMGISVKVGDLDFASVLLGLKDKLQVPLKKIDEALKALKASTPAEIWSKLNGFTGGQLDKFIAGEPSSPASPSVACEKHGADTPLSFLLHEKSNAEVAEYAKTAGKKLCPPKATAKDLESCFKPEGPSFYVCQGKNKISRVAIQSTSLAIPIEPTGACNVKVGFDPKSKKVTLDVGAGVPGIPAAFEQIMHLDMPFKKP